MSELWAHQKKGIELYKKNGVAGFFFQVGTGKTRTAIECLRHTYNFYGELQPTLIISPLITLENWKREIAKYTKIPPGNVGILHGTPAKKMKFLEKPPKIIITNYETLLSKEIQAHFLSKLPMVVVLDESHLVKSHNSRRSKFILQLSDKVTHKIALTGTPVLNSQEDLWSQIYFLDSGKRLEKKHHFFKVKYFFDKNANMPSQKHFPDWRPRPGSPEMINSLISDITMSVKKSECLDLPPFIRKEVYVTMSAEQERHYLTMKKEFVTYLKDAACVAQIALTKVLRMQQILSGFMTLDTGEEYVFQENPRITVLKEMLEELAPNHKVIIWAPFKANHLQIKKLCEEMGLSPVMLTGDMSKKEKEETMLSFETDPKVRVCIGNQSVGIGVNLVSSDVAIYFGRTYNLGHDLQSEGRNYRGGSEIHTSVTRYDLVCPNTIDEQILQALRDKKEIGLKLLKDISFDL